jgi:hypothetical protein
VRRRGQDGQILLPAAMLLSFFFGALAIYVIDTRLVEAGYEQLADTLQASAEDASNAVDVGALRASDGKVVALDRPAAKQLADRSMTASQLPGLESWSVGIDPDGVTITGTLKVRLFVLGTATLTETRGGRLAHGQ